MPSTTSSTALVLTALAAFTTAQAPTAIIQNLCGGPIYLSSTNASGITTQTVLGVVETVAIPLTGVGNSLGITDSSDYFSPSVAKLIFATSDSNGILYWSLSSVDGAPFPNQGFELTSGPGNPCGEASGAYADVHTCDDAGAVLRLEICI